MSAIDLPHRGNRLLSVHSACVFHPLRSLVVKPLRRQSVTTRSSVVKETATGLISPTSISRVLMPFAFEDIALRSQVGGQ
jgi:hypothetical protein